MKVQRNPAPLAGCRASETVKAGALDGPKHTVRVATSQPGLKYTDLDPHEFPIILALRFGLPPSAEHRP